MIVWHDRHSRSPDDIEDRQVSRAVELLNFGAAWFAEPGQDSARIGDRACHDVLDRIMAAIDANGGAAVGNKAIDLEHGQDPHRFER
jgi:hypothetical protein